MHQIYLHKLCVCVCVCVWNQHSTDLVEFVSLCRFNSAWFDSGFVFLVKRKKEESILQSGKEGRRECCIAMNMNDTHTPTHTCWYNHMCVFACVRIYIDLACVSCHQIRPIFFVMIDDSWHFRTIKCVSYKNILLNLVRVLFLLDLCCCCVFDWLSWQLLSCSVELCIESDRLI